MKSKWRRMCEDGEIDFDDICDVYQHMKKAQRKERKREQRRHEKMEKQRAQAQRERYNDGIYADSKNSHTRKESKDSKGPSNTRNSRRARNRPRPRRIRKERIWAKWRMKQAGTKQKPSKEATDSSSQNHEYTKSHEQSRGDTIRRKERQWQQQKAKIRKQWHENFDAEIIFF